MTSKTYHQNRCGILRNAVSIIYYNYTRISYQKLKRYLSTALQANFYIIGTVHSTPDLMYIICTYVIYVYIQIYIISYSSLSQTIIRQCDDSFHFSPQFFFRQICISSYLSSDRHLAIYFEIHTYISIVVSCHVSQKSKESDLVFTIR